MELFGGQFGACLIIEVVGPQGRELIPAMVGEEQGFFRVVPIKGHHVSGASHKSLAIELILIQPARAEFPDGTLTLQLRAGAETGRSGRTALLLAGVGRRTHVDEQFAAIIQRNGLGGVGALARKTLDDGFRLTIRHQVVV